jgi:phthiocerol/phenolphthiocerol synthesis type-I polyketide synthase E
MSDERIDLPGARDIAVIGMACRFPGARGPAELWRNLRDGVESVSQLRDDELLAAGTAPELLANPRFVRAASLLDGIEEFDAPFFGYSAHEAEIMDPQQRLFLEHAWEALEDAGHLPASFDGLIGIYAGVAWNTYLLCNLASHPELFADGGGFQVFIANDKDFMPSRVSYKLDLKGPSVVVQTSCSTSLVATHLACLSLLNYECDMALAGGVTVRVPQRQGYLHLEGGLASPDGHCRAFDAAAAGTIFGSGAGVVVLRRLSDALAGGDRVRAVIKGSAINNDGSLKVSYTAPSVEGQSEVVAAAQAMAGLDPETIGYIETHGTATALGDPVEVAALTRVFRERTAKRRFCALGSIKSNFGHLDAAAGIAGLIKTVLALEHRQLPPSLHFVRPNPAIDFADSPFYVNAALADWRSEGTPRRAGVSSFGVGGTNAHVILEEAPPPAPAATVAAARPWQLLVLSARSEPALEAVTDRLAAWLRDPPPDPAAAGLADIAYTLRTGRTVFRHRRVLVCAADTEPAAVAELLRRRAPETLLSAADDEDPRSRPVTFLLPGQGAQHPGMGRGLYAEEAVFRDAIDHCAELLLPHWGLDLRRLLWPPPEEAAAAGRRLERTELTQPALFAVEVALARLWMSWGVLPQALLGHSIGELAAACLAGVFSLPDAIALVAARGRLAGALPPGAMLSVPLAEAEIAPWLPPELAVAAVNEPDRSVIAGPEPAMADLEALLTARGVRWRRLHTSHAFHSPAMEPAAAAFADEVRRRPLSPPAIPFLSNVTGTWITAEEATDPAYWGRQLRQPVRFAAAVAELLREPRRILLEVGPGRTLATAAGRHPERRGQPVIASLGHPQDPTPEGRQLHTALGRLWLAGLELDPRSYYAGEQRRRVPLPTYPFERRRYWIEPARRGEPAAASAAAGAGAGADERRLAPGAVTAALARDGALGAAQRGTPAAGAGTVAKRPDLADWFYLPVFQPAAPLAAMAAPAPPRSWLVLAAERVGAALAQALTAAGHRVVTAAPGECFTALGGGAFAVNPRGGAGGGGDFGVLLAALRAAGFVPDGIVHAWSLTREPRAALAMPGSPEASAAPQRPEAQGAQEAPDVISAAGFEASQELGFYSLLALARELAAAPPDERAAPLDLVVVTNQLVSLGAGEPVRPEKAPLLGFCRVLPLEQPRISCRCLDVALPAPGTRQEAQLLELLGAEIASRGGEDMVAMRGMRRWVPGFAPLRPALAAAAEPAGGLADARGRADGAHADDRAAAGRDRRGAAPPLRAGGVYLLTGGLAGNGFALARWLAREAHARLVLLEPHGAGGGVARSDALALNALEAAGAELAALGGEVLTIRADATDESDLRRALGAATARWGALHGVIHAASLEGERAFGPISELGREACSWIFAPKVHPLFALERVLSGLDLDFCVLLSSLAGQLGGTAYAAHCAANLVLDAFAQRHNRGSGTPWLSVQWDVWSLPEEAEQITALRPDLAALAMSAEEGEAAFQRALSLGAASPLADVLAVSTGDLAARLEQRRDRIARLRERAGISRPLAGDGALPPPRAAGSAAAIATPAGAAPHPRPPLPTPFSAPVSELERRIAALWQAALGYAPIGLDDNFFELGGDSFVALQMVSRLRDELQIELSAARLYQGLTVRTLAALITVDAAQASSLLARDLEERRQSMGRREEFQQRRRAVRRGVEGS